MEKMEIRAKKAIEKVKSMGYVFAEKGKGLLPIDDFKDTLVLLAVVLSAVLNKKFPVIEIAESSYEVYKGRENIDDQFLDMDEDEAVECFIAFAEKFELENVEQKALEYFIEQSFFAQLQQAKAIVWFINNKNLPGT